MQPGPVPIHFEHVEELKQMAWIVVGWIVCGAVGWGATQTVAYIFKDGLKQKWEGWKWRRNVEFRSGDQVWFYSFKEYGVIEYMAKQETVFTMYDVNLETGTVTGGKRLVIQNSELGKIHIARLKPHFGDPRVLPDYMISQIKQLIKEKE